MRKRFLTVALVLAMGFTMIACGNTQNSSTDNADKNKGANSHYPVTIETCDQTGKQIKETFKEKPKAVITTNQPPTELLLTLGLGDCMVGTSFKDNEILPNLKEAYDKIPVLSKEYPSKEVVLDKHPDFIFGWSSVFSDKNLGSVETWNEKGVNTLIQTNSGSIKDKTLDNVYKDISNVGKIFDIEDKANKLIDSMKNTVSDIEKKVNESGKEKPKVLIIEGENNEYFAYGKNSLAGNLVEKAGGVNIVDKGCNVSREVIIDKNPDAIILIHYDMQKSELQGVSALKDDAALKNVNAIKNNKIIYTPLTETYAGGIRSIDGIKRFAKGFYPDLFK